MSVPNEVMRPATCAPTSTVSLGSMVPLALMVAATSPRFTTAVRKHNLELPPVCHHQPPTPRIKTATATATTGIFKARCMSHKSSVASGTNRVPSGARWPRSSAIADARPAGPIGCRSPTKDLKPHGRSLPRRLLHPVDQDFEAVGDHRRAAAFAIGRFRQRAKFGGGQVDPVRRGIQRHRPGSWLGFQNLNDGEFV